MSVAQENKDMEIRVAMNGLRWAEEKIRSMVIVLNQYGYTVEAATVDAILAALIVEDANIAALVQH